MNVGVGAGGCVGVLCIQIIFFLEDHIPVGFKKLFNGTGIDAGPPTVIIESSGGWRMFDFREIYEYRDLFLFLVYKAIRTRYAQSALGVSWAIIQPFFTMVVFTIIFGYLVKVESDGIPYAIFSFMAMVPWTYFQESLTQSVSSLISEQNMVSKIYFPRVVLPLTSILARFIDFLIASVLLAGMLAWYGMVPNIGILMLPVLILMIMLTASGLGMFLGAMAVQYRDINYGMSFATRLLMYAAPVVYPASLVPDQYRIWYGLNPMVGVIEGFRSALAGANPMPWDLIIPGMIVSVVVFFIGGLYFRRKERVFADVA